MHVEVVYCPEKGVVDRVELNLTEGATLDDALRASGVLDRHRIDIDTVRKGVWSKARPGDTALRERDRCEVYRPLTVDPKEARRLRYRKNREGRAPTRSHSE